MGRDSTVASPTAPPTPRSTMITVTTTAWLRAWRRLAAIERSLKPR